MYYPLNLDMKTARIIIPKQPLEIQQLETPKPKGSQVLVKVQSSGVCHSDIHLWEGGYEGPHGLFLKSTDRGVTYPLTPGHEIAGIVDSLGEDAKRFFTKNEKVVIYPWIGEGLCPAPSIGGTLLGGTGRLRRRSVSCLAS
jgi:alcohol dehydrogenase, propanol-preferring